METRWKDANPLCATPNGEYKKEHIYIFFFNFNSSILSLIDTL